VLHIAEQEAAAAMRMSLKTYRRWEAGEDHMENLAAAVHRRGAVTP
jgi:DNA-binding transcriptional regulator YiaG